MTTDPPPQSQIATATDGPPPGQRRQERIETILAVWQVRWPAVFTKPVPLAIGISRRMREQLPEFPRREIGIALHSWTNRRGYLRAMARGDMRRNLDGSEAGIPTEEAREQAQKLLEERERRQLERIRQQRESKQAGTAAA
jgi:sRNA-binding protein